MTPAAVATRTASAGARGARPRVLMYTDSAAFGGAEQALALLIAGLAERGWRTTLLHQGHPGLRPLVERAAAAGASERVVAAMPEGLAGAGRAVGLARALRADRPAVFHAHLTWPFGCKWALAAACAARVPAVVATAQLYVDVPMGLSRRLQLRALASRVGRLIAVSAETRDRYRDLGWPASRLGVVHNAIDVRRFDAAPAADLAGGPGGPGRPLVVVPARLEAQKGHDDLIRAATRLPGVRFACVGDGALRGELQRMARERGVAGRVTFTGFREDMGAVLAAADLVALPSLYEGLPLALIEAMAAGRPVVATDVGGTGELVLHGETGLLVPPREPEALAEAIRTLLEHPAEAARMGEAGRRRARAQFSVEAMVGAVEDEYRRLLAGRRGAATGARR